MGLRLGAAPASIRGPYSTEEAWILDEIVRDITEMSAYPSKSPNPTVTPAGSATYRVSIGDRSVHLDLHDDLWAPARFADVARTALGTSVSSSIAPNDVVHPALLEFTPAALVTTAATVSRSLKASMREARAQEAAALTVGAFALRESAGRFYDTRWAMNRMTAHLAMAAALTTQRPASTDVSPTPSC